MRKIILAILLLCATNVQAGFITGMIVGSVLTSSSGDSVPGNAKTTVVSGAPNSCSCANPDTSRRFCAIPTIVTYKYVDNGHWYKPNEQQAFWGKVPFDGTSLGTDRSVYIHGKYRPVHFVSYEDTVKICSNGATSVVKDIAYVYDYKGNVVDVILEW